MVQDASDTFGVWDPHRCRRAFLPGLLLNVHGGDELAARGAILHLLRRWSGSLGVAGL